MSMAHECDLCGALFRNAKGVVTIIEMSADTDDKGNGESWSEIDFCLSCSEKLLALIRPALDDLPPR